MPASFFVPAVSAMLHPEMIREIKKRGRHEIGVHGWIHENYHSVDDRAEEERLMNQAIDYLTEAVGKRPVGFRAPAWVFSKHTLELIRKAGFLYDSSLDDFDVAYQEGTMMMLAMHPHLIGRRSRIVHLDRLIAYMKSKPGVWFASAEQVASYVKEAAEAESLR